MELVFAGLMLSSVGLMGAAGVLSHFLGRV